MDQDDQFLEEELVLADEPRHIIRRLLVIVLVGIVLVFLGYVGWLVLKPETKVGGFTAVYPESNKTISAEKSLIREGSPIVGPADAKIVIVEFGDFECPFCRESFPVIRTLIAKYANDIKFVYRHFPVPSLHINAIAAAEASMCANEQGKFLAYHDRLFQNQERLDYDNLKRYARQIGINGADFDKCVDDRRYKKFIEEDMADGINIGVSGTPTWFINGRKVEGAIPAEIFNKIIEKLL